MKKVIVFISFLIIIIPFLIVTFLLKEEKINNGHLIQNKMIKIKREDSSIIEVPFEEYIVGVLAGEMPAEFELEALKAQAVASRSYVLYKINQNKDKDYDILDTTMNQVYLSEEEIKEKWKDDYDKYFSKIKQAINETSYEYLEYNGEVIEAFFFSTSAGKTENSEEVFSEAKPYLRSVDSSWDSEVSKVFSETTDMSLMDFYTKLNIGYNKNLKIEYVEKTSTGRIKKLKINDILFDSSDVRTKLNLKSTFFEINQKDSNVEIKTKGYGHGVGMSQYGALAMAKKGYNYEEILKYYYQGVNIAKIKV